jgi:hypothetical protein
MKTIIVSQVREMLDRDWSLLEIAARLKIDLDTVKIAAEIIQNLLT